MSRGSRSPKRDRHHRSSRHHRERSRERESSMASSSSSKHKKHRKSSRDREEKHKHHNSERDDFHKVESSASVRRYDTTQRGIDAAKNRLRASLGTAISDLNERNQIPGSSKPAINEKDYSDPSSVFDSLDRQKAIEQIEQDGFTPARFSSGNNASVDTFKTRSKRALGEESGDVKLHEKAMFGALWTSREIEQKLLKDERTTAPKQEVQEDDEVEITGELKGNAATTGLKRAEPSIAHERLSADPAVRQEKWLEIFRHRRRALIEGSE